jgi:hypothetical protein
LSGDVTRDREPGTAGALIAHDLTRCLPTRRCRERRLRGAVMIELEISPGLVNNLVRLGWLAPNERGNREAVRTAFALFCRSALARAG